MHVFEAQVLLQLTFLDLGYNRLEGTLPESWSNLTSVSHCRNTVYLLIDAAPILQFCKALNNNGLPELYLFCHGALFHKHPKQHWMKLVVLNVYSRHGIERSAPTPATVHTTTQVS